MDDDAPLVIGLDVGTSAVKAALYGPGGRIGDVVRRAAPAAGPVDTIDGERGDRAGHGDAGHGDAGHGDGNGGRPGRVGTGPGVAALRTAVFDALATVAASAPRPPGAVALSTAMHALLGLDASGRSVTGLVTWADTRASGVVARWAEDGSAAFVHDRTGVPLHPMAPVAKLAWFAERSPDVADQVERWVDLKALVVGWLTDEWVTEYSSASGWGLMDIRRHTWDPDALALARVDADRLPPIASPTATRPLSAPAARQVGLAAGTPVVLGGADGPLGNVGVGAVGPGVAGLSLGTSGAVRLVVDEVPAALPGLFCYALDERHWVVGGAVSNGGNVTSWLADTLLAGGAGGSGDGDGDGDGVRGATAHPSIGAVLDLAASAPPGSDGLVMLPYLVGERAPLWDADLPGAWLGLRRRHTSAHLARAALEGVCAGLGVIVDRLDAVVPVRAVRATGGACASPLWRGLVAAAMRRPTTVTHADDGSALGAAAMGLVALGVAADPAEARAMLVGDAAEDGEVVTVPDGWVEAAEATREGIVDAVRRLDGVADAYRP